MPRPAILALLGLASCATPPLEDAPPESRDHVDALDLDALDLNLNLDQANHRLQQVLDRPQMPGDTIDAQVQAAGSMVARHLRASDRLQLQRLQALRGGGAIGIYEAEVDGLPVVDGRVRVLLDADGRLHAWSADLGAEAALRGPEATLSVQDAVTSAAVATQAPELGSLGPAARRDDGWQDITPANTGALARPARARAVAFEVDGVLHRAWQVELWVNLPSLAGTDSAPVELIVDAADGSILRRRSLQRDLEVRVWAETEGDLRPLDGPLEDTTPHPTETPDGWDPEATEPVLIEIDGFNAPADPWLAEGVTTTSGNHADTYADHAEPDGFGDGDVYGEQTAEGVFDHVYDTSLSPTADDTQTQAAIVQAFTTVQWLHDWFYDSGFDEAAGNAQLDNFGRGGLEEDAMKVEVQDRVFSGGLNNANMSTPSDGDRPRMQIYVWSGRSDASLVTDTGLEPEVGTAAFGPDDFEVSAEVAEVGSDSTACTGIDADVSGKIALIDRGDCLYVDKVGAAEDAGAVGVIVVNHTPGDGAPTMGGSEPLSTPALSVSYEDGELLRDDLDAGSVEATLYRQSKPLVDGSLDNTVLAHEWGHYILARLMSCGTTQCGGIHEGFADFNALLMSLREGDDLDGIYTPAAYAASGISEDPVYYGTRRVPYSRDTAFNALSFRHISEGEELPDDLHPMAADSSSNTESHNAGEIWATAMFDAYLALQEDGPDAGRDFEETRRRMGDIIVAGFILAPAEPTYLELRDALLAAAAVEDPHDAEVMAAAFADRGMGSCAVGPDRDSEDLGGITEDFELRGTLGVSTPTLTDSLVSCDDDGWLDGGEGGELRFTVSNTGGVDLEGAELAIGFSPAITGLDLDVDLVELDLLPAFTTTEVAFGAVIDRHVAVQEDTVMLVVVSHEDACVDEVQSEAFTWVETDVASGVAEVDDFDAHDESWSITGDDEGAVWTREDQALGDFVWQGADVSGVTDTALVSPPFVLSDALTIDILHRHSFEVSGGTFWDGGVIELSVDGGDWEDISAWADPGYGGELTDRAENPLAFRQAFVSTNASWPEDDVLTLELGEDLVESTVQLRFRIGTDLAASDVGWTISEVGLTGMAEAVFPALIADETDCNPAPVADAGEDITLTSGDAAELDGSASTDPTGEELSFTWVIDGLEGEEVDPAGYAFTAPEVTETTSYTATLRVSDGDLEDTDEVVITVEPVPPEEPEDTGETGGDGGSDGAAGGGADIETSGCGCGSGGSAAGLLVLLLGGLRRRES